ncbi:MAG: YgjP-like metallopeptidase domain-containing protein [Polyangiaceae bacterium]
MKDPVALYLGHYPETLLSSVRELAAQGTLGQSVLARYPAEPEITTDQALQGYVAELKNRYLKRSAPLSKICFDDKQTTLHRALGLHTKVSRVQGGRLKAKQELRVASLFKQTPPEFLRMVVVHELAHLRESDHNKAFYQLCCHMEPDYHQLEFDLRLYLAARDLDQLA